MPSIRRCALFFCLASVASSPLLADSWYQPTAEQLKMTSDPAAPNAAAVYLDYENVVNDAEHYHLVSAVVKILTDKGKEQFGEIVIPYEAGEAEQSIDEVEGRTIEPDGTVVPFHGKPYKKELLKDGGETLMEKAFSLPDVRVGSIIEYRYQLDYSDNYFLPPRWFVQQPYFVHHAHYHFDPAPNTMDIETRDALGHTNAVSHLVWFPELPAGDKVVAGVDGYDLVVNNVPAAPDEPYMPPLDSFSYRLFFYYSPYDNGQTFWTAEGRYWSKDVNRFADVSDRIRQAVAQITAPGDSPDQKLQKIYAAVETVENTDFTREHTSEENKLQHAQIKNAADVWEQKRGDSNEIDRLFIAMARAAGFKAYDMIVTDRSQSFLNLGYLNWGQLSDEIAIVNVDGREQYFDPGERYTEYGKLDWVHQITIGVRQTDDGTKTGLVPSGGYKDNTTTRIADLTLAANGQVSGQIRVIMNGAEALRWRQMALRKDVQATQKAYEKMMQGRVPEGVQVTMSHFLGLADPTSNLMAILNVSGAMGTVTGKRVFEPAMFFEARVPALFPDQQRENPVDLHSPYMTHDQVTVTLAPGLTVESVPDKGNVLYPQNAVYQAAYGQKGNIYEAVRLLAAANTIYKATDYPNLRKFYQGVAAQDQQQVVLDRVAVQAAGKGE